MPRDPCAPCLHPRVKEILTQEFGNEIMSLINRVANCPDDVLLNMCDGGRRGRGGPRARSAYQEVLSGCLKGKVKGIGTAGPALRECAAQWRARK